MNVRAMSLSLSLGFATTAACAGQGLAVPAATDLWPQWQARITVLATGPSSMSTAPLADSGAGPRALHGGALLGDYTFATPSFGRFRASGGLMSGHLGGLPLANASAGPRLGVAVVSSAAPAWAPGSETPSTLPYLGLGFSGAAWLDGLALTADVGIVAERPSAATGLGRALFGNQGVERSLRELRLAPVMQLGVRYTF